ncbi:MAG: hypothetical protein IJY81_07810 [Lachnospiraceae bacterium]|nr:hypothetical protein [Lachnospiraceae bacterium]
MESMIEISKEAMRATKWAKMIVLSLMFFVDACVIISVITEMHNGMAGILLLTAAVFTLLCVMAYMLIHIVRLKAVELVKR